MYVCVLSTFSNIFSETTGPIEAKLHVEPPWDGGTKVCSNGPSHMTKMAVMPIYGKKLKNLLPQNQKADDLESWYAASGAWVLPKWWPWVELDLFYGKVKFAPLCFRMGKKIKQWIFLETIVDYDLKLATDDRSGKKFLLTSKLCPLGAVCPLSWGYIPVLNHEKKCIKSDFKEISLKLATNG